MFALALEQREEAPPGSEGPTGRVVAGLQILFTLLQNVSAEESAAQSFYQTYFCDILQHIFSVVTDTSHTAGKPLGPAGPEPGQGPQAGSGPQPGPGCWS